MKAPHLNDQELQDAVLDPQKLNNEERRHFESCPYCRQAARAYADLFGQLSHLPAPVPEFDTVAWVMAALPEPTVKKEKRSPVGYIMALLALALVVVPFLLLRKNLQQVISGIAPQVLVASLLLSALFLSWRISILYRHFRHRLARLKYYYRK